MKSTFLSSYQTKIALKYVPCKILNSGLNIVFVKHAASSLSDIDPSDLRSLIDEVRFYS